MEAMASGMGLLAAAGLLLGWGQRREHDFRRRRRHHSLDAVRQGIALMSVMQQHRGMASALLNGDKGFAARLADKRREVDASLAQLGADFSRVPALAAGRHRLDIIYTGWVQLCQDLHGVSALQSFARHTALLQQVLFLLGDMGERGGLLEARSPTVAALGAALLLRLPLLAESIGQARALGAGFAAQGRCGAVGRIRLRFQAGRIVECLAGLAAGLDSPALTASAARCRQQVEKLLALIESGLIGVERITLAPDAYFRCATEAIDACLSLWQEAEQATRLALATAR